MENGKNFCRSDRSGMPCCDRNSRNSLCSPPSDYGCDFPSLAMVYNPAQCFVDLYEQDEALCQGTLFKELNMPFEGSRNVLRGVDGRCVR